MFEPELTAHNGDTETWRFSRLGIFYGGVTTRAELLPPYDRPVSVIAAMHDHKGCFSVLVMTPDPDGLEEEMRECFSACDPEGSGFVGVTCVTPKGVLHYGAQECDHYLAGRDVSEMHPLIYREPGRRAKAGRPIAEVLAEGS